MEYRGFYIYYHPDICGGIFAIYRLPVYALNIVQAVNWFNHKESCIKHIDKILGEKEGGF